MLRVGNSVSNLFPVRVRVQKECVRSLWLFDIYMDGVVIEENARMLSRGLSLVNADNRE